MELRQTAPEHGDRRNHPRHDTCSVTSSNPAVRKWNDYRLTSGLAQCFGERFIKKRLDLGLEGLIDPSGFAIVDRD